VGWVTGPYRPLGGRQGLFFSRDLIANLNKKNLHLRPVALWGGDRGGIFEIFQNGHIFLKFLFLKNIKKKKTAPWRGLRGQMWLLPPPASGRSLSSCSLKIQKTTHVKTSVLLKNKEHKMKRLVKE